MECLPVMATLAERLDHALKTRGIKPAHLDRFLAKRFAKKGAEERAAGTGYTHRVLKKGQQPGPEVLAAIAEHMRVSLSWLITGQGAMDPGPHEVPTYDSLTGWAEAAAIEMQAGRVAGYAIRAAGRAPAFVQPEVVDAAFVFDAAMFWLGHAPVAERRAWMQAEAERLKRDEDDARQ